MIQGQFNFKLTYTDTSLYNLVSREGAGRKESLKQQANPLSLWVVWNKFLVAVQRAEKNQQEEIFW